jgi:hypothetical protein
MQEQRKPGAISAFQEETKMCGHQTPGMNGEAIHFGISKNSKDRFFLVEL